MSILAKYDSLRAALAEVSECGGNPFSVRFDAIESATTGRIGDKPILLMGTNNYLGLTFDPESIEAARASLSEFGTGTTGSRVANGSYGCHDALERRLADFYGMRSAMVFSTGYQANLGMISTLATRGDYLLIDADSHASIYDSCRLTGAEVIRFRHSDAGDLERRLRRLEGKSGDRLVVVEGLYSMLGDRGPLAEIAEVTRAAGAYLLVDEAHSLGVFGAHGRGVCEDAGIEPDFVVGTFSKSLGSVGGFCASNIDNFDILRLACRPYMFTASLPPSVIASVSQALTRIETTPELRTRLMANGERLYAGLASAGFALGPEPGPIVAVKLPSNDVAVAFWNAVLDAGIYMNLALPPATPSSEPLLRASVTAAHSPQQIDFAIGTLTQIGREIGVIDGKRRVAAAE